MTTKVKFEPIFWFFGLVFLHNVNANFKCPAPGRYLDPLSDCKKFFFCYNQNSELLYVTYKCPEGKLYSVEETKCITASNLECKELSGTTPNPMEPERDTLDEFICQEEGKFVNELDTECKSYITCSRISGNSYSLNLYYCPMEKIFSHDTLQCVSSHQFVCPTSTTTKAGPSEISTSIHEDISTTKSSEQTFSTPQEFICTRNGRFPNLAQPGCQTYILCSQTENGTFISQTYFCENSAFDPNAGKCIVGYICRDDSASTAISGITCDRETTTEVSTSEGKESTSSITSTNVISTTNNEFKGEDTENTTYLVSTSDESSGFTESINTSTMPGFEVSTIADSTASLIDNTENDESKTTQSSPETETSITTNDPISPEFICTKTGRFPNLSQAGCRYYILCSKNENGIFISHSYICYNSYFDPNTGRCSLEYICPDDNITTTIPETTHDTDLPSTQYSTPQKGDTTTKTELGTSTDPNIPVTGEDTTPTSHVFHCTKTGKFPNLSIAGCGSYILCIEIEIGTFYAHNYFCYNSSFDPNTSRCSLEYICPNDTQPSTEEPKSSSFYTGESPSTIEDSTEYISTTSQIPTSAGETTEQFSEKETDTSSALTTTQSSSSTLIDVSTYPPRCMVDPINQFICPNSGRYKDANSIDCKTYILCLRTVVGELVYAKLRCIEGTLYSDEERNCVSTEKYSCSM